MQFEFENGDIFVVDTTKLIADFPEAREIIKSSDRLAVINWCKVNFTFEDLTPYLNMIPKKNYNYQLDFQLMS